MQNPGNVPAATVGLNSDLGSMGLLAGRTDSDLLPLFSYETEVDGSSREEMESRESRFFFSLGPGQSLSMSSKIERRSLIILVLDRDIFLREVSLSSEEEEEEESLDFRFDFFREDFFLWDFLLELSLISLWLLSLSLASLWLLSLSLTSLWLLSLSLSRLAVRLRRSV